MKLWKDSILLLAFILFIFIAGCTLKQPSYTLLPKLHDPKEYLLGILDDGKTPRSMSGIAKIKIASINGSFSSRNVFFIKNPSFIRLEMLGLFGHPSLFFVTCNHSMKLFIPSKNICYTGDATDQTLSPILGFALPPSDFVRLLFGYPPAISVNDFEVSYSQNKNDYFFQISAADSEHHFWVDPSIRKIKRYIRYNSTSKDCELEFRNFTRVDTLLLPLEQTLRFYNDTSSLSLTLEPSSTQIIPDNVFELTPSSKVAFEPFENFYK